MPSFDHQSGRTLAVDGAEIYFESTGSDRGPPLVLLHGGMGNIEDFNGLVSGLGDFHLIGIDARGHGKSTLGATGLSYERLEKDLAAVLGHLSIPRATILGFSDGAIVAYRFALSHPSKVEKLISIGGPCDLPDDTAAILESVTAQSWSRKFPETVAAYQKHNPQPDFDAFVAASRKMWLDRSAAGYPGRRIEAIECPTLIVRGDQDPLFSLAEAVEIRTLIERSQLLHLPAARHVVFDDSREMCVLGVKQFLRPESSG
jgi:pimeloyl-ACP methyl ester carboxylesterase